MECGDAVWRPDGPDFAGVCRLGTRDCDLRDVSSDYPAGGKGEKAGAGRRGGCGLDQLPVLLCAGTEKCQQWFCDHSCIRRGFGGGSLAVSGKGGGER